MKNNYYPILLIALFVLVGGSVVYTLRKDSNTQPHGNTTMEDTSNKPVAQSHRSYDIEVTSDVTNIKPNDKFTFSYKIKNDKGAHLKNFEIAHEKIMHLIVVRKDLQDFQHLHPELNRDTGEFTVDLALPNDGPYRFYPDFTPAKSEDNPMLLPVTVHADLNAGDLSKYKAVTEPADDYTTGTTYLGDYVIRYGLPNETAVPSQKEIQYNVNVMMKDTNGMETPVTDLEKYLGALGHSVIIKEGSLDYIHTHAIEAKTESRGVHGNDHKNTATITNTGPQVNFATTLPEIGKYKIFTQVQHKGQILTADYVVKAE